MNEKMSNRTLAFRQAKAGIAFGLVARIYTDIRKRMSDGREKL